MRIYDGETLKVKLRRRKIVKKTISVCLALALAFIVICIAVVFCQKVFFKKKDAGLFGYSSFGVVSGSMEPSIGVGDIVVVHKVEKDALSAGDIIAFFDDGGNVITHRIAEIYEADGVTLFRTKGDANNGIDGDPVTYENIIGKYAFRIAGGMRILAAVASPLGILVIVLVLIAVGGVVILKINKKAARHSVRERYQKQSGVQEEHTTE